AWAGCREASVGRGAGMEELGRTSRCSSRRPRSWLLVNRRLSARPPAAELMSFGDKSRESVARAQANHTSFGAFPMICHVCGGGAVGQCKGCAKFYCAAHGDIYCVRCTSAVQAPGQRPQPPIDIGHGSGAREPATPPSPRGPGCCECGARADRACAKCGRFFCDQHGGMGISRTSWSTPMCNQCTSYEGKWMAFIWGLALLILIGGLILFSSVRP